MYHFILIGKYDMRLLCLPLLVGAVALGEDAGRPQRPKVVVTDEAIAIHRQALLIDGHNDLPWELRTRADSGFTKFDVSQPQPKLHTDIPRLRKGGVGGVFWSAYV